jgi:hypothetical protein
LTEVSFPKRKSERTPPRFLLQAFQEGLKPKVSSRAKSLKSGLGAPEILRTAEMVKKLFDSLFLFFCHHILAATLRPVLREACR